MAKSEFVSQLQRLPQTLGTLLIAPARALRQIAVAERGGFFVLVAWCIAAALTLRFVDLADAFMGLDAGGGMRLISVVVSELTAAVPVALAAALLIVIGAGQKRDPSVDLELGCAAAVPFMVVRAVFRAAELLRGHEPSTRSVQVSYVVAAFAGAVWTFLALRIARARPVSRGPDSPSELASQGRLAGWGAAAVLALGLVGGVRWTAKHAAALGPVTRGAPAPDFTLPRVDGKPGAIALSSLRGKVVVLDFWATWCPPCQAMLPTMHELSSEMAPQGVAFLGVDSDGPQTARDDVERYVIEHGLPYPVVYDEGVANDLYRVRALPTMVVLTKDGTIARVLTGMTTKGTLKRTIEAALAL